MRKINVAILGLGRNGAGHLRAIRNSPHVGKIYGYEPEPERARSRGVELGIETVSDLDAIIGDPKIDLVYVSSPNEFHCGQTVAAAQAGKAVLCEKPMGVNWMETRKMLDASLKNNSFLQIGFELHYSKLYSMAKEWIGGS